jgi:hypothetical protein
MALTAELQTLEVLYNTLKNNVTLANEIQKSTDRDLTGAVWESPNANTFREAWAAFKPALMNFENTLAMAASDVANNHNNNAQVNGVRDAPHLAQVTPLG